MDGSLRAALFNRIRFQSWIVSGLFVFATLSALAQRAVDAENPQGKWEVLEGCRLMTNAAVDGDSFKVMHKGREYVFRLYFVDTPEADASVKERVQDQAAYFGVSITNVPPGGRLASAFTRDKLAWRDFTIVTRWQNAMGRSTLARFYCVALVKGENLAEELVKAGWARIYGLRANWPDGPRSATFINKLKNLELSAREQRRGMWDEKMFPRATGSERTPITAAAKKVASGVINLNEATFEELQTLPGIGPVLAQRLIAGRPYRKVEDLLKVSGIGAAKLEQLKPLIRLDGSKSP